jgi:hypothetical protein
LHWSGALGGLCVRYPPGSNCQEPSRVDGSVHRADSGFQFQGCRWGSTHGMPRNPGEPYHHPMMVPPVPENAVLCQAGAGNLTGFVRRRLLSAEAAVCFTRNSHRHCNQTRPMRNAICSLFHLLATVSAPSHSSTSPKAWPDRGPSNITNNRACRGTVADPLAETRHLSGNVFHRTQGHHRGAAPCQPQPVRFARVGEKNPRHVAGRLVVQQTRF